MTRFVDCRLAKVGGELSKMVTVNQGTNLEDYTGLALSDLLDAIQGRDVLIATHGFNVNRAAGIACLSNWEALLQPKPFPGVFVGLLWPGDSVWAHGLDYPDEPKVADQAGALIGPWLDANFSGAASISFASHSLGARVVLETINNMSQAVRRITLMAGAVDDDCLTKEFQAAAARVGQISVLSSKKDEVLSAAFPIGNFFAGIIAAGHPWWRGALGHGGPAQPWPQNFQAPFAIPENWNYQHGNYLEIDNPPAPALPLPINVPANGSRVMAPDVDTNGNPIAGWSEEFSAAFVSTRFR
jgi:Alpha/beta hydrolase of unknown function (DUF900)